LLRAQNAEAAEPVRADRLVRLTAPVLLGGIVSNSQIVYFGFWKGSLRSSSVRETIHKCEFEFILIRRALVLARVYTFNHKRFLNSDL
jgi:hypothetical protein